MSDKTILIIEDSYSSQLLLEHTLRFAGYKSQLALNVNEAIKLIKDKIPDLIILDLNMPELSGFDFLEMKGKLNIEKIPVIVVSALDSHESIQHSKDLGVSCFISKPVKLDLVVEKVKSLIGD
jgi:DNA-binding response OmpR family regulator